MANLKKENPNEIHYTPIDLIEEMFKLLDEFHPDFNLLIENSAGSGNIIDFYKNKYNKPYYALDINSLREDIIEGNYLKHKIEYKPGNVSVFNPPFKKGIKFFNKSLQESDYVVAILALNSLFNIDYNLIDVDRILIYRGYDFGTCKTDIMIISGKSKVKK